MANLPTSEEILVKNSVFENPEISNFNLIIHRDGYITAQKNIKRAMIEFAKIHVEAALKAAYENIEYTEVDSSVPYVVEDSILNSYSLENIK
jgi:hypothetical protein